MSDYWDKLQGQLLNLLHTETKSSTGELIEATDTHVTLKTDFDIIRIPIKDVKLIRQLRPSKDKDIEPENYIEI